MTNPFELQRLATRDPADGDAMMTEFLKLDYDYLDTGADLTLPIAATATNPIVLLNVVHIVKVAFTGGTPAIDVGDGTTADAYIAAADITEGTIGNIIQSRGAGQAKATGEYLTAARAITVTLSADLATGTAVVLAEIFRL